MSPMVDKTYATPTAPYHSDLVAELARIMRNKYPDALAEITRIFANSPTLISLHSMNEFKSLSTAFTADATRTVHSFLARRHFRFRRPRVSPRTHMRRHYPMLASAPADLLHVELYVDGSFKLALSPYVMALSNSGNLTTLGDYAKSPEAIVFHLNRAFPASRGAMNNQIARRLHDRAKVWLNGDSHT